MERALLCEIPDKRRKTCVQGLFFLEIEGEQFLMFAICNGAISRNRIKYSKNTTRKDSIKYNSFISAYKACVVGIKKEGEREGEKRQREKGRELSAVSSLSPQSPSLFPFLPIPYPFGHLLPRQQHTPSQVLLPTLEEWSRFFPKQVHHINVPLQVPHTEQKKTEVKQHLIRDKFLSNPIKQKK